MNIYHIVSSSCDNNLVVWLWHKLKKREKKPMRKIQGLTLRGSYEGIIPRPCSGTWHSTLTEKIFPWWLVLRTWSCLWRKGSHIITRKSSEADARILKSFTSYYYFNHAPKQQSCIRGEVYTSSFYLIFQFLNW